MEDCHGIHVCTDGRGERPGGDYHAPALDIGWGMRPDLTGKGHGTTFVRAILDFARTSFTDDLYRTTVATFNTRSQRVCENAGFRPVEEFAHSVTGDRFVLLTQPA